MIITTTENVNGKIPKKTLGLVRGNTIRARWFGRDIAAGLKGIVGGEIKSYTKMISDARDEALNRMVQEAKKKGADAIIGVRFTTSDVLPGSAEILAFGTAVKI
jgi:uncharacterized protein YbjQ (UPF0145 family)